MLQRAAFVFLAVALAATPLADACTRILYESGSQDYIVGRSMDWFEDTKSDLWAFPQGMRRDGGVGDGSILWVSRYGSVVTSMYGVATVDGINEAGLVGNMLYLAEADYGTKAMAGKASLSIGAWLQYVLDNYATVDDAVSGLRAEPFRIVAPNLPDGKPASAHLAISDAKGDSAIFEYVKGKLTIHHGPQFTVMTNSPIYDKQLAINTYWDEVGGNAMLPGTYRAADRFVRRQLQSFGHAEIQRPPHGPGLRVLDDSQRIGAAGHQRSAKAQYRHDHVAYGLRQQGPALLLRLGTQPQRLLGRSVQAEPLQGARPSKLRSAGRSGLCRRSLRKIPAGRAISLAGARKSAVSSAPRGQGRGAKFVAISCDNC